MGRPLKEWKLTDEQAATVEANRWLAVGYARRNCDRHRLDRDDATSICYLALCRAVYGHDPAVSSLATYAYPAMERALRHESEGRYMIRPPRDQEYRGSRFIERAKAVKSMKRLDSDQLTRQAAAPEADRRDDGRARAALATLDPKRRRLIERLVIDEECGASIADEMGVSRQLISFLKTTALVALRRRLRAKA
jgi:RNA polymerase sigma factor (sigma-70 family)